jgi:hypothetical protein
LYNTITTTAQQSFTRGWVSLCGAHLHVRGCCAVIVLML